MTQTNLSDTIVALATPSGVGAIGVIRLSGPEAIRIADDVFPSKELAAQASHTLHVGTIRNAQNRVIDEVVVSLFVGPRSYTGEDVVEISCHGSNYILQEVIQLLLAQGARLAEPGEYTMRAFLNGRMDLSQAEAVADLIASSSASSHKLAMQQMRGGFSSEIQALRQKLIDFASLIELELDFGEEDVEFADRDDLRDLINKLRRLMQQLLDSFRLGNVIKNGGHHRDRRSAQCRQVDHPQRPAQRGAGHRERDRRYHARRDRGGAQHPGGAIPYGRYRRYSRSRRHHRSDGGRPHAGKGKAEQPARLRLRRDQHPTRRGTGRPRATIPTGIAYPGGGE